MQLFYTTQIEEDLLRLPEQEAIHAGKVLRKQSGDELVCTDGMGNIYHTTISELSKKACVCRIDKKIKQAGRNYGLHIAIAPTKNNTRFEWFLEKATEIGVDEITPVFTANSERNKINHERFKKVLVSAMKQSQSAYLPKLNAAVKFSEWVAGQTAADKLIAHCRSNELSHAFESINKDTLVLIGPEGDFTVEEVEAALQNGFTEVSLGSSRLRTETAGVVAAQLAATKNR